jgi:anti-sigma28 factor (negative regulator of flagellin synthesis)
VPNIEEIQYKIANNQFELSKHAVDQSISRQIRLQEIREAIANGQIIEDYPNE